MQKSHKKIRVPCEELVGLLREEGREAEAKEYEELLV